jgi:hypothetical protein
MRLQALLAECLLSGFFAVACLRARAESTEMQGMTPRSLLALFALTGRLERLRKTRWQWCSMVLLLILMRLQAGAPVVAELTVAVEFVVFLALPSLKASPRRLRA